MHFLVNENFLTKISFPPSPECIPVLDALVVSHPGEGDGGVEGHPPVRCQPVQQVVQLLTHQKRFLVHQVSHLNTESCVQHIIVLFHRIIMRITDVLTWSVWGQNLNGTKILIAIFCPHLYIGEV